MHFGTLLQAHGVCPAAILRKLDIPPSLLLDPDGWIDRRLSFRLATEMSRAIDDRFAGAHYAELQRLEEYGDFGHGILCARTLKDAVLFAIREIEQIDNSLRLLLDLDGPKAYWSFEYQGDLGEDPVQHVEANLKDLRKILDLASEPVPAEVRLPHARPQHPEELERLLGPDLVFDAERAELVFARDALSLPLRPHRIDVVTTVPERRRPPASPRETGGAVMRVLREMIELERPTASCVAAALSMNLRTMQRHLAVWDLTFEQLLDEYRLRRAMKYLNEGEHTITDIAFRLGYSDSAHFTRAFRRWVGASPRQVRAHHSTPALTADGILMQVGSRRAVAMGPRTPAA